MAQMTPQLSQLIERALALSTQDRGLLINTLIASLGEHPTGDGAQAARYEEVRRWFARLDQSNTEPFPEPGPQPSGSAAEE